MRNAFARFNFSIGNGVTTSFLYRVKRRFENRFCVRLTHGTPS